MKLNLPPDILSQQDLKAVITEIQDYSKWFGQTSVKLRYDKAAGDDLPTLSPAATQLINGWSDVQLTKTKIDELVTALIDFESSVPRVTIILAAPAPNKLKHCLIDWFRLNVNPDLLINFKFNATILGGMVVSYDSHIYDWSFRRQILANRDKFPEILRNV